MKKYFVIAIMCVSQWVCAIDLELTQGINAAIPIAIETQSSDLGATEVASVIRNDFNFSGQFRLVEMGSGFRAEPWDVWQRSGADHVLSINAIPQGGQRYVVAYQLKM